MPGSTRWCLNASHAGLIPKPQTLNPKPSTPCRLKRWLDELLWEDSAAKRDIYRMKGCIWVGGSPAQHVLQAVQDLYEVKPGPAWAPEAEQHTKIVIVGRGLELVKLQEGLDSCAAGR